MIWGKFVWASLEKPPAPRPHELPVPWKCQKCGEYLGFYIVHMTGVDPREFSSADEMRNYCYCPRHKPWTRSRS